MGRQIEPFRGQPGRDYPTTPEARLPERFFRWLEVLRSRIAGIPIFTVRTSTPEGALNGVALDIAMDTSTNPATVYVKTTASGNTGWSELGGSGSGSSGAWTRISIGQPAGDSSDIDITWDESLYHRVQLVLSGLRVSASPVGIRARLGHTNGTVFVSASTAYAGSDAAGMNVFSAVGASNHIPLSNGIVVFAGSDIDAVIDEINGNGTGANGGSTIAETAYVVSANSQQNYSSRMRTNGSTSGGVIDSIKVFTTSGVWLAAGNYTLYGLTK